MFAGGQGLTQLLDDLVATFGPGAVKCATVMVDTIVTAPSAGVATSDRSPGVLALEAEMNRRGWSAK